MKSVLVNLLIVCVAISSAAQAPNFFQIVFETTVQHGDGEIVFNISRANSPNGVDHIYELLTLNTGSYYDDNGFFRVVPNFVVQFGINGDPTVSAKWQTPILDDPVVLSNIEGTLCYATAGPNTRTTQLYINYANNSFLDAQGFSPIGMAAKGMDVALAINAQYGEQPDQGAIYSQGNKYLQANFPKLDYITRAYAANEEW